jgi:glycosyltransferase involved in cell wall biosynthesis
VCSSDLTDYAIPIKLFEACATGKAIVISATPSTSSIMADKYNCLFFNPGDYNDLANKIQIILDDKDLRRSLSKAAQQLANEYSWEQISIHFHNDIKHKLCERELN